MTEQNKKYSSAFNEEVSSSTNPLQERVDASIVPVGSLPSAENCLSNTDSITLNEESPAHQPTCESSNSVSSAIFPNDEASSDETKDFSVIGMENENISYVVSNDSDATNSENMKNINLKYYRDDIIDGSDNSDSSDTESSSTVSEDNEDSDNASLR